MLCRFNIAWEAGFLWKAEAIRYVFSLTYLLSNWASCIVRCQLSTKTLNINEYLHIFNLISTSASQNILIYLLL